MDEVLLPSLEDASRKGGIRPVPNDGVPVGVDDQKTPARSQNTIGFREGDKEVGHEFVDLGGDDSVEGRVWKRELGGVP